MSSNSQPLTAFITPWGLYEWVRIPFGLSHAPGEFQSFMENCLRDLRATVCVPYLNDIIIFSATFEDHIENTPKVLRRLKEYGVKLKPRKCKLFERGYIPCAHCVGRGLKARSIQYQETVSEVRRLMGFLNYYR